MQAAAAAAAAAEGLQSETQMYTFTQLQLAPINPLSTESGDWR